MAEGNFSDSNIVTITIAAAVTAIISVSMAGNNRSEEFRAEGIANLPGVITRVDELDKDTDRRFDELQEQLNRRLDLEIRPQITQLREEMKEIRRQNGRSN